ncbi:MAG TPA: chemotaxis protein CheB [Holophagaceae bacterium]|nr:chemotaxis protein CheB [Holophagaceae bacterium]
MGPRSGPEARPAAQGEATSWEEPSLRMPPEEGYPPIVGIGASAGGLGALEAFFSNMPPEGLPGMAFVVVQHLAPDHKSMLADLIRRFTNLAVVQAEDGMEVRPDSVYVIPPNCDLSIFQGHLQLVEPHAPRGMRLPIDVFFRSLAQDMRERAIGIVLSGTGSDGTLGIRAIKGEGGLAMAQAPESAEYDGMPGSAIGTGLVDLILPPAEMPRELLAFNRRVFTAAPRDAEELPGQVEESLRSVFSLLRGQTGHDFSLYKRNTVHRRIERRMAVHQIDRLADYVNYLRKNRAEVEALFRDLMIGVTRFFRDPEAFEVLRENVIPRIISAKPAEGHIRVWVPGCSTGEEAYSIAILLHEQMNRLNHHLKVQVFATDLDRHAIDIARMGSFPASIATDVPPEILAKHFTLDAEGGSFRIHKGIRDSLIFSEQDVIKDPPFSKLDLISCRNLLIYMGVELQKRLIPLFHYSLNPGGYLFLGTSETVGEFSNLFDPVDRKAKLYQSRLELQGSVRPPLGRFMPPALLPGGTGPRTSRTAPDTTKPRLREITERALLQHHGSVGALVNERGDILYLHGRMGKFLEPAPGEAGMNVLKMAREGLQRELTSALHKAVTHKEAVCHPALRVKANGEALVVKLTLRPVDAMAQHESQANLYLMVLEEVPEGGGAPEADRRGLPEPQGTPTEALAHIEALKQELRSKEDYLQSTNEQLETSNEELKVANEEMQSINEELQSTNEELETSKEELQSVNEEMATVNAELQLKVLELSRANNDMNNLLGGTGVGTVFVDHLLRIQRFTPAATQVINLIPSDVGRPLSHIVSNFTDYSTLVEDVRKVMDDLVPKEIEVETQSGIRYLLRIRPYRTLENVIEGAVITSVDISEVVRGREGLDRLAAVVRDASDAITMQDLEGRIRAWNPGAVRLFGWTEAEALAMNAVELIPPDLQVDEQARIQRLAKAEVLKPIHTHRLAKSGQAVEVWLTATALINASGEVYAIATTIRRAGVASPLE